ncbi:nucleotidyltransferase family protein [Neomicrococcus lactis]
MTNQAPTVEIPQATRVRIAHALVAVIARENHIDVLHVKGYAAPDGLYHEGRLSTDADVLVRPHQANALVQCLHGNGWRTVTSFESGSIFKHAAALWHDMWGYVDVHRSFPGFTIEPTRAFDLLWGNIDQKLIGNQLCNVPSRLDHALIIAIHASRDPTRGHSDTEFVLEAISMEKHELRDRASLFGAMTPYAIATNDEIGLREAQESPDFRLWKSLASGAGRLELFLARIHAAPSMKEKVRITIGSLFVNRDHLQMRLDRQLVLSDYLAEFRTRALDTLSFFSHKKSDDKS